MTSTQGTQTTKTDYRWRRVKVIYLAVSVVIVFLVGMGVEASNNTQTCGQTPSYQGGSEWWKSSSTFDCTSAKDLGEGTSMATVLIPTTIVLGVGYLFLPRLYRYLSPRRGQGDRQQ